MLFATMLPTVVRVATEPPAATRVANTPPETMGVAIAPQATMPTMSSTITIPTRSTHDIPVGTTCFRWRA